MDDLIRLRPVTESDLDVFFEQQRDPQANQMAAFTAPDPHNWAAFAAHWARILADPAIRIRTIVWGPAVAGHVASFERDGAPEVQ